MGELMAHEPCIGATDEWFTPPQIFDALGLTFDLDPCSPGPGHWVPARKIYTIEDDGLPQPWEGLTFVNPPFGGRNGHVPWLRKFLDHGNGIAIVRAYTKLGVVSRICGEGGDNALPQGKNETYSARWFDRSRARARRSPARHGRDGQRRPTPLGSWPVPHALTARMNDGSKGSARRLGDLGKFDD